MKKGLFTTVWGVYNSLNKSVRRIKLKKQFLLWLFILGMGYIFIELQRFFSNTLIDYKEWIGFALILGAVIWLWVTGDKMDKAEKIEQNEKTKQLVKDAIKELKDDGVLK